MRRSADSRLPLLMMDGDGQVQWQVTAADKKPATDAVFEVRDLEFVRNDAGQDISGE
ncbi:MAG: hypothetical protein KGN16_00095 [Burkholderiales bacterium]|nr:hypothetical protein [Burkholderiales bacterium]